MHFPVSLAAAAAAQVPLTAHDHLPFLRGFTGVS